MCRPGSGSDPRLRPRPPHREHGGRQYARRDEPFRSDCRWHARAIDVSGNEFRFDPAAAPCSSDYCGVQALLATGADNLPWSPYTVAAIQDEVMFGAGNHFADNRYYGPWLFAKRWGGRIGFAAWQAAPYLQDAGSSIDQGGGPMPGGDLIDADTATLEGSIGHWGGWYDAAVVRSAEQAHGGSYSLRVDIAGADWGVEVGNYPGYAVGPGAMSASVRTYAAPAGARMVLQWLDANGAVLASQPIALVSSASGRQQASADVTAPAATASVRIVLVGSGGTGTSFYLDDLSLETAAP